MQDRFRYRLRGTVFRLDARLKRNSNGRQVNTQKRTKLALQINTRASLELHSK